MNKKRDVKWKNVILALLFTIIIFIAGLFLGNQLIHNKYNYLQKAQEDMWLQTQSINLHYEIISEDPCKSTNSTFLVRELDVMGQRLEHLETIYGKSSQQILSLKQQYSHIQIQHWLIQKEIKKNCNISKDLILYFYSNENCPKCERQGEVLSALKAIYKDDVLIYSHDSALNDPASITLRQIYNVVDYPTIVYNENVFRDLVSLNQLRKIKENE